MAFGWAEWQGFIAEEQWEMPIIMQKLQKPDLRYFPESPSLYTLSYCLVLDPEILRSNM